MTSANHDLMRAEDDGMIVRETHHPENTDPPSMAEIIRKSKQEVIAHYRHLLQEAHEEPEPGTRVHSTRRDDRGKVEGWDDALGLPLIAWESSVGLEACNPHEYRLAEKEGLNFYPLEHILGDALAEWTVGDYREDGSLALGGEILLRLPDHAQLGVQVQAFSDGQGTLQRFLGCGVFSRLSAGTVTAAEVENLLVEHGIKGLSATSRVQELNEEIRELQAQDRQDDLRHDAEADTAIESEDQ